MSSLTIEELKRILAENGVPLPSGRIKKEDYVQLYEEHVVLNGSIDAYSDEEESQNSKKVSSSNQLDSQLLAETIENLTDDELFQKLGELGFNPGPIVPSSRRIYEKKLIRLVNESEATNGDTANGEFSDQEERPRTPSPPPPPPRRVSVPPPEVPARESSVPRRYTYVEKISRVSKERIIEPIPSASGDLRFRPTSDVSDGYKGRWSPSASLRSSHTKITLKKEEGRSRYVWFIIGAVVLAGILIAGYVLLPTTDNYQLLEEDAVKHTKSQTI